MRIDAPVQVAYGVAVDREREVDVGELIESLAEMLRRTLEPALPRGYVFDIDDALWVVDPRGSSDFHDRGVAVTDTDMTATVVSISLR